MIAVHAVHVPEYQVDTEPDHRAVGKVVDAEFKRAFMGRTVVARGVSLQGHPGKTIDELVEIIDRHGTDRYDPHRKGDRYDNIEGRHIDLFGFRRKVSTRTRLFEYISWGFYHGAIEIHGKPARIDLVTVYDVAKLKVVPHQYEGRTDRKRDGFAFREPDRKRAALLGIVTIT